EGRSQHLSHFRSGKVMSWRSQTPTCSRILLICRPTRVAPISRQRFRFKNFRMMTFRNCPLAKSFGGRSVISACQQARKCGSPTLSFGTFHGGHGESSKKQKRKRESFTRT